MAANNGMNDLDTTGWSAKYLAILRHYRAGMSHRETAAIVGLGGDTVKGLVSSLGIAKTYSEEHANAKAIRQAEQSERAQLGNGLTEELAEQFAEGRAEGNSYEQIALKHGVPIALVKLAARLGNWANLERRKIREASARGFIKVEMKFERELEDAKGIEDGTIMKISGGRVAHALLVRCPPSALLAHQIFNKHTDLVLDPEPFETLGDAETSSDTPETTRTFRFWSIPGHKKMSREELTAEIAAARTKV